MRTKYQALLIKKSDAKVQIKFKMGLKNWDKIYPPNSTLLSRQDRIKKKVPSYHSGKPLLLTNLIQTYEKNVLIILQKTCQSFKKVIQSDKSLLTISIFSLTPLPLKYITKIYSYHTFDIKINYL